MNLKATHEQLAERAARFHGHRLSAPRAGGDKLSTHVHMAAGDSARRIQSHTSVDYRLTFKCVPQK